jgi:hypothetical protein
LKALDFKKPFKGLGLEKAFKGSLKGPGGLKKSFLKVIKRPFQGL